MASTSDSGAPSASQRGRAFNGAPGRWVLLIHQIPPKPDYFRVKVWRRLQRLGAVAIKNSVYVLPRTDDSVEDFQWQMREITAEGGEASVCEAMFVDGLSDAAIENLFRAARESDYRALLADAKDVARRVQPARRRESGGALPAELGKLRRRLADIMAIDFFGAPSRRAVQDLITRIEEQWQAGARSEDHMSMTSSVPSVRGTTWVTRTDVHVDRIGSAWLIRRFIDPEARFKFVPAKGYRPVAGELRFDMFDAEYTHEGEACTFETLTHRFDLQDSALRIIGEIVHDIDYKESKFGRPEAAGVERMIRGIVRQHADDATRLTHGATLFDTLYEAMREGPGIAGEAQASAVVRKTAARGKRKDR
jgi:hypothetical protein